MTTEVAPPTIPSVETGTPPKEWSASVLASNVEKAKETPASMPGGLDSPKMSEDKSRETESKPTVAAAKDQPSISATVVQTAKQYMPEQVGKTVDYATQTAATAASYLPIPQGIKNTVSSYLSPEGPEGGPHVSLPSTELKGAQPSERTGGVGALPGNLSESSVALLPDERQERAQERRRRDTIKATTAGGDEEPGKGEEAKLPQDVALPKDEKDELVAPQPSDVQLKSTETRAAGTVDSGTGAASGSEVAPKKEARETERKETLTEKAEAAAVHATGMVGVAPGAREVGENEEEVEEYKFAPEGLGHGKGPLQDVREGENKEGQTAGAGKVEGGYGGDYHPAQLHPPPSGASVAEHRTTVSAQKEERDSPAETSKTAAGAEKKPGFMTMVKGEMKILAGKMSGDEHKVEEGKKIVHGET